MKRLLLATAVAGVLAAIRKRRAPGASEDLWKQATTPAPDLR